MPIPHKTFFWLLAALLLGSMGMTFIFWSHQQIDEASNQRLHSRQMLVLTDSFLLALKDAELGAQGYVLTGIDSYLPPYLQARANAQRNFADLRSMSLLQSGSQQLDAMAPWVDAQMQELATIVALRHSLKPSAATTHIAQGEGQRLMNALQTHVNTFVKLRTAAQGDIESAFASSMRRMYGAILAVGLLALLFTLYFARSIYRDAHYRIKRTVHQKTQDLLAAQERSNVQLHAANATLRVSEERLAVTLNSIGDAVIATDANARITLLNPVAEVLTGWSKAQAVGQHIDSVFHIIGKESRQPAASPMTQALAKGVVQGLANHTILIARDGREFDIADSCAPIRDADNHIIGAVLVFRNVTAEHRAQQAAQDSAALVRSIFNTVADGIVTFHAQGGKIESTNPAMEALFGYTASELKGTSLTLLVPELNQIHTNMELAYFGVGAQDRAYGLAREVTGRRADGSSFSLEIAVCEMPLRGERFFTALLRDISTRKAAEGALRNAGALQRAMSNNANFSSIATDVHGVIQIFNVGAQRMLGYSDTDVMNRMTPADLLDPQDLAEQAHALSLETGSPITPGFEALVFKASRSQEDIFELTYIRKHGGRVPALVSVTALRDDQNATIGYLLISMDNTTRKIIEADQALLDQALISKNVELEVAHHQANKANLAKSEFLSSMSHELRTPLGAILGFAQLLESGTPPPTATQKRSIDQILKAGWYLLELINEVLDLALVESGKIALSMEPVSLSVVLEECHMMVEPLAQKSGIRLVFNPCDPLHFVQADRTRLKQVLINLLSNAIKYNRPSGTVTVDCSTADPSWVRLSVRDTGAGLKPEQLAQLFQPFNRLGRDHHSGEGTGIGLVVCKRLIELMAGQIGFASTAGEGSVFWFQLASVPAPRAVALAARPPSAPKLRPVETKPMRTLLYVEDNPANLMLVADLIARHDDVRLLTASDGNSGIEMARAHLPDVILMDINLPGINGMDALRVLTRDATTSHIPVIALSANAIPRDIEKGLQAGFLRYLTKPIKIKAFTEALDMAFDKAATAQMDLASGLVPLIAIHG